MRNRPSASEHADAVSRRLATLSAELAAVRGDPPTDVPVDHPHTRVRVDNLSAVVPPPAPVPVGAPGRHAARRGPTPDRADAGSTTLRAVTGRVVDRVALEPAHLGVLAVVVALALGLTAWTVIRSQAEPAPLPRVQPVGESLVTPVATEVTAGSSDSGAVAGAASGATSEVTVDVAGKVRRPGIAVLPAGSRVVDALEAAGGARRGVDLTGLNLARVLVDGEQLLVGVAAPTGVAAAVTGAAPPTALVNLNTADQATLETLPGVGPVTATAIIGWRTDHGAFTAVEELLEVDGIGEATLEQLAPHVTV